MFQKGVMFIPWLTLVTCACCTTQWFLNLFFQLLRVSELIKYQGILNTWSVFTIELQPTRLQYVIIHVKMP